MVEHYNGRYPFWISPRPATIISVSQHPDVLDYIEEVRQRITHYPQTSSDTKTSEKFNLPVTKFSNNLHVDIDISAQNLGKKIKKAKEKGYNFIVVVGPQDVKKGTVSVEMFNQYDGLTTRKLLTHAKILEQGDGARTFTMSLEELEGFVRKMVVHYL